VQPESVAQSDRREGFRWAGWPSSPLRRNGSQRPHQSHRRTHRLGGRSVCDGEKHLRRLQDKFPEALAGKHVICLNIPDDYQFMQPELIELLQSTVPPYLEA
jgi:hypothetical protein